MAKSTSTYFTDDDSGISLDYASSTDLSSSTITLIHPPPSANSQSIILSPRPTSTTTTTTTMKKRLDAAPLIKFAPDGVVERVRPMTMKNSENGDYILCRTDRGAYVAYRTPVVPQWVTRLVEEIEFLQQ